MQCLRRTDVCALVHTFVWQLTEFPVQYVTGWLLTIGNVTVSHSCKMPAFRGTSARSLCTVVSAALRTLTCSAPSSSTS